MTQFMPMKSFKPRPYDPDRPDTRSDAQKTASMRNFDIFKMRGFWAQASMLRDPYRSAVRALIDADLTERGALPQQQHQEAARIKRLRRRRERAAAISEDDMPF